MTLSTKNLEKMKGKMLFRYSKIHSVVSAQPAIWLSSKNGLKRTICKKEKKPLHVSIVFFYLDY